MKTIKKWLVTTILLPIISLVSITIPAFADMQFGVTPTTQKIVLTPGEEYHGTFGIVNPIYNTDKFYYKLNVEPFYVDENNEPIFKNNGDYNQIVDWIKIDNNKGSVDPNNTAYVNFTINVPNDAPAGGQYAMVRVSSDYDMMLAEGEDSVNIQNIMTIAHIIYAEIAGTTERHGEVIGADLPSFLLSGNITGSSTIKNTGNVHGTAKYTLQVFPLFSNEEVYTNEENPLELTILPDRALYSELAWDQTPPVGIFNVKYTVEFEGVTTEVSKMVIICPIWLLFIIIFVIIAIIIWIVMRVRSKNNKARKAKEMAE